MVLVFVFRCLAGHRAYAYDDTTKQFLAGQGTSFSFTFFFERDAMEITNVSRLRISSQYITFKKGLSLVLYRRYARRDYEYRIRQLSESVAEAFFFFFFFQIFIVHIYGVCMCLGRGKD